MAEDIQNLPLRMLERRLEEYQKEAKNLLGEIENRQNYLNGLRKRYKETCEKIDAYQLSLRILIHGSLPVGAIIEPKLEKDEETSKPDAV